MKGIEMIKAAGIVTTFFALIRPQEQPPMWFIVVFGLVMYECILWMFRIQRKVKRERKISQNVAFRKRDGEALDNELFNPLKGVRA